LPGRRRELGRERRGHRRARGGGAVTATRTPIGRVVGTERKPNTPHEFHFWTAPDSPVGIGALVKLQVERPRPLTVYGIVVDGAIYTDLESALHDYVGLDGEPAPRFQPPTERPEIRLYTAAVLRHEPEEP